MYQLDPRSRAPLYQQLEEKILQLILAGALRPGEILPSVRVMARELGINPNTVAKAYQDLEKGGLIHSVAGKGSFVSEPDTLHRQVEQSVLDRLREALQEGRRAGVGRETACRLLDEAYEIAPAGGAKEGDTL